MRYHHCQLESCIQSTFTRLGFGPKWAWEWIVRYSNAIQTL